MGERRKGRWEGQYCSTSKEEGGRKGGRGEVILLLVLSFLFLYVSLSLSPSLSLLQVAPDTHWSDLQVLILVVSDQKKPVSSTSGMMTSVETSSLINVSG